jgi:hypothetical protein
MSVKIEPMKMTVGFVIHALKIAAKWSQPRQPYPEELVELTHAHPELFPTPWTLEQACWALANVDTVVGGHDEIARDCVCGAPDDGHYPDCQFAPLGTVRRPLAGSDSQ